MMCALTSLLVPGLGLLLSGAGAGADGPAPPREPQDPDRAAILPRLEAALAGTPFRLADVIWDLDARYGCFADLDGDGDLDYVATEMIHGQEPLSTWLRTDGGWVRASTAVQPHNQRHPLGVHVLPAYEEHPPALVLPTGWPPYLILYPTDGRGRFDPEDALSLERDLPRRISQPLGVDNCPYQITRIEPPGRRTPPRIHGLLVDQSDGGKTKFRGFRITIDGDRIRTRMGQAPDDHWSRSMDWQDAVRPIRQPATHPAAPAEDRDHPLRADTLKFFALDVDQDGVEDLVQVTADLAAHVFRGTPRVVRGRRVFEEEERAPPRGLPIEWVALHAWSVAEEDLTGQTGLWYDLLGFGRTLLPGARAPLGLSSLYSDGLVYHTFDGERLVAHLRRVTYLPHDDEGEPRWRRASTPARDAVTDDFNGDGVPEVLTVLCPAAEEQADQREEEALRHPLLSYWTPAGPEASTDELPAREVAHLLLEFPERVTEPFDPNKGRPLNLTEVPIEGTDRVRYCVYFRPWRLGLFLEVPG